MNVLESASEALGALALPCIPKGAETTSLLGRSLQPPRLDPALEQRQRQLLDEALGAYAADPDSPDALIWCGRRLAYLGQHRLAVGVFSLGIELFPPDATFLRHRGHRFLTLRLFDRAHADLAEAWRLCDGQPDALEPDGIPNDRNEPTSTLHFNVLYHLGLSLYLQGQWAEAEAVYRRCLGVCQHPDSTVATIYWLVLSLLQQGRRDEAVALGRKLPEPVALIESGAYLELVQTLIGQSPLSSAPADALADATLGYGRAAHDWFEGERERAIATWERLADSPLWAPFGVIASEAALAAQRL